MAEAAAAERAYGGQTMVEPLRRVLVRRPPADTSGWRRFGWRSQPDPVRMAEEHEAFCLLLEEAGAEVVVAPPTTLDAIYAYDPAIVGDAGAVLLRPGKPERLEEVDAIAADLERAGVPVAARLDEPASAEGGDTGLAGRVDAARRPRLPDERRRNRGARADPRRRDARLRPAALPRPR